MLISPKGYDESYYGHIALVGVALVQHAVNARAVVEHVGGDEPPRIVPTVGGGYAIGNALSQLVMSRMRSTRMEGVRVGVC
jgi:hypothetical protein